MPVIAAICSFLSSYLASTLSQLNGREFVGRGAAGDIVDSVSRQDSGSSGLGRPSLSCSPRLPECTHSLLCWRCLRNHSWLSPIAECPAPNRLFRRAPYPECPPCWATRRCRAMLPASTSQLHPAALESPSVHPHRQCCSISSNDADLWSLFSPRAGKRFRVRG